MDLAGYAGFLLLAVLVVAGSFALDWLFVRILPVRFLYYAVRLPGVILHELAHIAGCILTGAKVKNVVLFSKEGGSVSYANPEFPVLGNVIIGTAPLIVLPLVLSILTWIFATYLHCTLAITIPEAGSTNAPCLLVAMVIDLFYANLVLRFNSWFLLYLYLSVTIVLSLAPSRQDFSNAAIGIAFLAGCGLLILFSGFVPAIALLGKILDLMTYPFMLGLIFEMIGGVAALPLLVIYGIRSR